MLNNLSINGYKFVDVFNNITDKLATLGGNNDKSINDSKNLIDTLYSMDRAYKEKLKSEMPDYEKQLPTVTFEKQKAYTEKSDAEIEKIVQNKLDYDYNKKIDQINESSSTKQNNLLTSLTKKEGQIEENTNNLNSSYIANNNKIVNKTINQGLKNSSIYGLMQDSNYNAWQGMLDDIRGELVTYQSNINSQINQLGIEKRNALLDCDYEFALSKETQISKLQLEQEKAIEQINSYNKKIAESALKYQEDKQETIANMENQWWENKQNELDYQNNWGYEGANYDEMNNRYIIAKDYYGSIAPKDAKELIEQNKESLRNTLGVTNYTKLVEEINK
ncbi:MAG: hypothetical protein WCR54_04015 [Clostridia bacterium]